MRALATSSSSSIASVATSERHWPHTTLVQVRCRGMEAFRLMPRHRTTSRRSWPTPRTTGARPLRPPPLRLTPRHDSRTRPRNPHMKTTGTPAVEWPPGGASSTTSTASPRRAPTDFGALLDQHQARTAVAEGPKKKEALKPEQKKLESEAPARAPQPAEPKAPEAKPEATALATEQQPTQPDGRQGEQPEQPTVETPV